MIKGFALIPMRPDLTREQFHRHWREVHAPLALKITSLRRYVQSHRIAKDVEGFDDDAPFEGIAEIWFDSLDEIAKLGENPQYLDYAFKDEPNFISDAGPSFLATREHVIVEGPSVAKDESLAKALFLLKRRPGMSVAEYQDYWLHKHAPLVPREPGLLRYVQCHVAPETYEDGAPAFDGVAELWWRDQEAFERYWTSDALREAFAADTPQFLDVGASVGFLSEEVRIIWP